MRTTTSAGKLGENFAVTLLKKQGYKILTRNFKSKFGEIDIIALDGNTLVFVEVKTRWSKKYGAPEESVTPLKLRHLEKTVDYFKMLHPNTPDSMRIDVVATEVYNGEVKEARILKNVTA